MKAHPESPISTVPSFFAFAEECRPIESIPNAHKLSIKTIITKTKKLKTPAAGTEPTSPQSSPRQRKVVHVALVNIIRLFEGSGPKIYTLAHAFNEKFDVKQIFIKSKENLVYTL